MKMYIDTWSDQVKTNYVALRALSISGVELELFCGRELDQPESYPDTFIFRRKNNKIVDGMNFCAGKPDELTKAVLFCTEELKEAIKDFCKNPRDHNIAFDDLGHLDNGSEKALFDIHHSNGNDMHITVRYCEYTEVYSLELGTLRYLCFSPKLLEEKLIGLVERNSFQQNIASGIISARSQMLENLGFRENKLCQDEVVECENLQTGFGDLEP